MRSYGLNTMMQRTANENAAGLRRQAAFSFVRSLARVSHVTLANLQRFGFEFHLRSSPSAFSGCSVDQPITSFPSHCADKTQQGRTEGCPGLQFLAFSLDPSISLSREVFYVVSDLHDCFSGPMGPLGGGGRHPVGGGGG